MTSETQGKFLLRGMFGLVVLTALFAFMATGQFKVNHGLSLFLAVLFVMLFTGCMLGVQVSEKHRKKFVTLVYFINVTVLLLAGCLTLTFSPAIVYADGKPETAQVLPTVDFTLRKHVEYYPSFYFSGKTLSVDFSVTQDIVLDIHRRFGSYEVFKDSCGAWVCPMLNIEVQSDSGISVACRKCAAEPMLEEVRTTLRERIPEVNVKVTFAYGAFN